MAEAAAGVESHVIAATVYRGLARVTRQARVSVTQGPNRIRLTCGARTVRSEGLTARVLGEGVLHGVQLQTVAVARENDPKISELQERLETLQWEIRRSDAQHLALDKQKAVMDALVRFADVELPREVQTDFPDQDDLTGTLTFLDNNYFKVLDQQLEVKRARAPVDQEIQVLQRRLAALAKDKSPQSKVFEVLFDADKDADEIVVEVDYLADGAQWEPHYEAHVDGRLTGVDWRMTAQVVQRTGEVWEGVRLAVSSGQVQSTVRTPRPRPWTLDIPQIATDFMAAGAPGEPIAMAAAAPAPKRARLAKAERVQSEIAVEYVATGTFDIPDSETGATIPIQSDHLDASFHRLAVPSVDTSVYLVAEIPWESRSIGGPLQTFFDGALVSQGRFDAPRSGQPVTLNLGRDSDIQCSRERVEERRSDKMLGRIERDTILLDLAFRLRIANRRSEPADVRLYDAIPVAQSDQVAVRDLEFSRAPDIENVDDQEGVAQWNLQLDPDSVEDIRITMQIRYPKGQRPDTL